MNGREVVAFAVWALVGAAAAVVVAAAFTPVVLAAPIPIAAGALLIRARYGRRSAAGVLLGPAIVLTVMTYLNREGPGTICNSIGHCRDEWNPWMFGLPAAVLVIASFALFWYRTHGRAYHDDPPPAPDG